MHVSMPRCLDLCFRMLVCLDLCSLHALCYLPCACELHAMFVCLDLGYVCHAMCYCSPFVIFISFSCVLASWFGPDLDPMVFVIIRTPLPTSNGLDHSYMHVCLLVSILNLHVSLSRSTLYHAWCPWQVCGYIWCPWGHVWM